MMLRRHVNDSKILVPEKKHSHFNDHYDDSSDDEDTTKKISDFAISKSWKQKEKKSNGKFSGKNFLNNDELLSFVAHVAGLKLLYSSEVNSQYYQAKTTAFKEEEKPSEQLQGLIKSACLESTYEAFNALIKFLKLTKQKTISLHQATTIHKTVLEAFLIDTNNIILENLSHFIEWIKKNKDCPEETLPEAIDIFKQNIATTYITTFKKHFSLDEKKSQIDRQAIKKELLTLSYEAFHTIVRELKLDKHYNLTGKLEAETLLKTYQTPYKNLTNEIKARLAESAARGYVSTMLLKHIEQNPAHFLQAYINDLICIHQSRARKKAYSIKEKIALEKYLAVDSNVICDELLTHFTLKLQPTLHDAIKAFCRPTLGRHYLFSSNNAHQFYVNLRLSNRSQKRQGLNLRNTLFKSDTVSRSWQFTSSASPHAAVLETQQITTGFGRRDLIENLGNYEKVYQSICQIKAYFLKHNTTTVTDKDIAVWIRQLFNGSSPELSIPKNDNLNIMQKLQSITYLLFGCEATRNPAMHVITHMLLDLIIADRKWSFEDIFLGKNKMPMAAEGAVAVARKLESDYRTFMPYPYLYSGIEENECRESHFTKQDLVALEANIVRAWFTLNHAKSISISKHTAAEWLLTQIESHFKKWLEPNLQSHVNKKINSR